MYAEKPQPLKPLEKLTERQINTIRDTVWFFDQVQRDLDRVHQLQRKYSASISKSFQYHLRAVERGQVVSKPGAPLGNTIYLCNPFPLREVHHDVDPRNETTTKRYHVREITDITLGDLKHESSIHIYYAGDSTHRYIESRLGFGHVVEAPSGWTRLYVKAKYTNHHSCATWARWDECGTSHYRQEFACRGYLRVQEFWPYSYPLIGEATGLELRGTNQGNTGNLVLEPNGTIASVPPVHNFWSPGEALETDWVQFEGPSQTSRYLVIWSGLDCSHLDYANDYSLYSDLLFDLNLQWIMVQFSS
jgi:hypothetical protein